MMNLCDCYTKIFSLYENYKDNNKKLNWTEENTVIFMREVRDSMACARFIMTYIEKLNTNTLASKDEFNMFRNLLKKYNDELLLKAKYIDEKNESEYIRKLSVIDEFKKKTDPNYNASIVKDLLPSCPTKKGGKKKRKSKRNNPYKKDNKIK